MKHKSVRMLFLMTALMLLLLAGCGRADSGRNADTGRTSVRSGRTTAGSGRSQEEEEEEEEEEAQEQPEETGLSVNRTDASVRHIAFPVTQQSASYERAESNAYFYYHYDVTRKPLADDPEGLKAFLAVHEKERSAEIRDTLERGRSDIDLAERHSLSVVDDYTVFRSDSRVVSFTNQREVFNATPGFASATDVTLTSCNIDPATGREIALTDVVRDLKELSRLAAEQICQRYVDNSANPAAVRLFESRQALAEDIYKLLIGDWLYAEVSYTWAPTYLGLRMKITAGVASHEGMEAYLEAGGSYMKPTFFDVTVPYSMMPELFEEAYTALPESYFARIETETDYLLERDGELIPLRVEVRQHQYENPYQNNVATLYTGEIDVFYGQEQLTFDNAELNDYMNFGTEVYLAHHEGRDFLYLCQFGEYMAQQAEVYELTDGRLQHLGPMGEGFEPDDATPLDPSCFATSIVSFLLVDPYAECRLYLVRDNALGEDGMPGPLPGEGTQSRVYRVQNDKTYTLAVPVSAPYWDGEGSVRETAEKTYPAGTVLRAAYTDNKNYILFEASDSGEYLFAYATHGTYHTYVDSIGGMSLYDACEPPY